MPSDLDEKDILSVDSPQRRKLLVLIESKSWVQLLAIVLAAALLTLPCLIYGFPPAADAPTHVKYQHHFSSQFWSGESYPRWLAEENKGYGSPISCTVPAPLLRNSLASPNHFISSRQSGKSGIGSVCEPGTGCGGCSYLVLVAEAHPSSGRDACCCCLHVAAFILESGIYARGGIGELCTFAWMPLALSICETMYKRPTAIFALSGVFALLVVSNLLGTIRFAPVLTIYAISDGKWIEVSLFRRALLVFLAQLLGAGGRSILTRARLPTVV